jgi:hypothetical protein
MPDGASHFCCDWSWNPFFAHSHWTSALTCTEVIMSLRKWRQLILVNCLVICPGMMRWLKCALVNYMWLSALFWRVNLNTTTIKLHNIDLMCDKSHNKHFNKDLIFTFISLNILQLYKAFINKILHQSHFKFLKN